MRLFVAILGRFLAASPEIFPRVLCAVLGDLVWTALRSRRRRMMSSLRGAFPGKPEAWLREVGRRTCRRTMELGSFALASPYFSDERARVYVRLDDSAKCGEDSVMEDGPLVAFVPHFTLMEVMTFVKLAEPGLAGREIAAFYRPLKNATLNSELKAARERHGVRLISRKDGFREATVVLRRGGAVALLFDQNAGWPGSLSLFLGRAASTTEMPGMLAEKFDARAVVFWAEREGFWRATLRARRLRSSGSAALTAEANRWLEARLAESSSSCADWLWLHNRWKSQEGASHRFRLTAKRDITAADFASLGLSGWSGSGDRLLIRMPNWLGDIVMALPLVRAIRAGRPDMRITLLARKPFVPLLELLDPGWAVRALPARGIDSPRAALALRGVYPDTHLLFTNSFRGDLEARLAGAPQRFGMVRPGKVRPLLTHGWRLPASVDEARTHQTRVWELWLREAHGLEAPPDLTPMRPAALAGEVRSPLRVGLVCGTENFPAKRWPAERWRACVELLLRARPGIEIRLFGTAADLPVTTAVAAGFPAGSVENLAGKTDLPCYCRELVRCSALACNDTGGMHLANLLGVPVVGIFGPTNPLRTGPVFEGDVAVLRPPGCPETGGAEISGVSPERVAMALLARLA